MSARRSHWLAVTHPGRDLAERIGRVGVWSFAFDAMPAGAERETARRIEAAGVQALWLPESAVSKELFAHAALLLGATERLIVASGIANIWARDPVAMRNGARLLAEAFPGRFVLGLGVSHEPAVRRRGGHYERPLTHMREYLDAMQRARYSGPEPADPAPLVLAALGPRMLRLAAERTAGAHPYFVPVEHTRFARETLGAGPMLAVEQAVVFEEDPAAARQLAREHMAGYLRLENYANNLRRLGWSDADIAGPSDPLVDAVVAWGSERQVAERVRAHLAAGADHVCVQALARDPRDMSLEQTGRLLHALARGTTNAA